MSFPQSMLSPAGYEAERIAEFFWLILGPAAFVWMLIMGTAVYGVMAVVQDRRIGYYWIVIGGVVFPAVTLAVLAYLSLGLMTELRTGDAEFRIRVTGEQFWWRVEYFPDDPARSFETANEFVLPRNTRVEVELVSADVIHSFWIPSLAGKVDMIPGRVNRLVLEPTQNGLYRGQCAEFCGESHTYMSMIVRVVDRGQFEEWQSAQAAPATAPPSEASARGRDLFLASGCGGCHRIRGTLADGEIGPDLTHFGGRSTLAAVRHPNESPYLEDWILATNVVKPGVLMPAFDILEDSQVEAIALYLESLR